MGDMPIAIKLEILHTRQIPVPYPAIPRQAPNHSNYGYIDLRANPHIARSIPEVVDSPEMADFLEMMNSPTSAFRTIGCEKWLLQDPPPTSRSRAGSYIDIAFAQPTWNEDPRNFFGLFYEFTVAMKSRERAPGLFIDWELRRVAYYDDAVDGWGVGLWPTGLGETEEQARANWALGMRLMQEFFIQQSANQLSQSSETS